MFPGFIICFADRNEKPVVFLDFLIKLIGFQLSNLIYKPYICREEGI